MIALGRLFDWRAALVIVKPETFVKWHRTAFRMFWTWKSRKRGRPPLPRNIRPLVEMARENPTWGEEPIADELMLKLGIRVSPRTVRKYLKQERPRGGRADQRWVAFLSLGGDRHESCPSPHVRVGAIITHEVPSLIEQFICPANLAIDAINFAATLIRNKLRVRVDLSRQPTEWAIPRSAVGHRLQAYFSRGLMVVLVVGNREVSAVQSDHAVPTVWPSIPKSMC
jgi:hypothetical protein